MEEDYERKVIDIRVEHELSPRTEKVIDDVVYDVMDKIEQIVKDFANVMAEQF